MTRRLLLVEPSATMRHALTTHVSALGYELDVTDSYEDALDAIESQFKAFGADIEGLIFGWPSVADEHADALAERLESDDLIDLPVVVMSTDSRAATRAWAAARSRTSILAWKDYLDIDTQLAEGLEHADGSSTAGAPSIEAGGLNILLVDASGAVRDALQDVLVRHGYQVRVADSSIEALTLARSVQFDMVLLDFYLEETTADALCLELVADPACGDPACLVLTGSCAEHIVKRCLAAGATDCLFKSEPDELLLARIDAIGRAVRSRRELAERCDLLQRTFDRLSGSALLLDAQGRVRHATPAALETLSLRNTSRVSGMSVEELCGIDAIPSSDGGTVAMTWRLLAQEPLDVSVRREALADSGESYLVFKRTDTVGETLSTDTNEVAQAASRFDEVKRIADVLALDASGEGFVGCLFDYLANPPTAPDMVSLLVLGVHEPVDESYRALEDNSADHAIVQSGLARLYRREHHVAALGGHRFGFLIRHVDEPQSYLLTRRLMQMCNDRLLAQGERALATNACLVGLSHHAEASAELLLQTALRGLGVAESRGIDQALLLDLERMLAVYPETLAQTSDTTGVVDSDDATTDDTTDDAMDSVADSTTDVGTDGTVKDATSDAVGDATGSTTDDASNNGTDGATEDPADDTMNSREDASSDDTTDCASNDTTDVAVAAARSIAASQLDEAQAFSDRSVEPSERPASVSTPATSESE